MNESYYTDNEDWGNDLDDWDGVDWSNYMSGPDDWEIENQYNSVNENWNRQIKESEDYLNNQNNISEVPVTNKALDTVIKSKSFKHKKSSKVKSDLIFLSFKSASVFAKNSAKDKQKTFKIKRVGLVGLNKRVENCWMVS
jgi:hypothetical protein